MNKARDSHALTIVEIDLSTLEDDLIQPQLLLGPRYLVRHRKLWTGTRHTALYAQLKALAELWDPRCIVHVNGVDAATGVGAGLASFLEAAFGEVVIPFLFTSASKSKLGWDFLAVIETGRFKGHTPQKFSDAVPAPSPERVEYQVEGTAVSKSEGFAAESPPSPFSPDPYSLFWRQISHTLMDISAGPNRTMKWVVPDGTREAATGDLIHDDLVISAALCALLDNCEWGRAESAIVEALDPLKDLGEVF
jgi:hypothetical protein